MIRVCVEKNNYLYWSYWTGQPIGTFSHMVKLRFTENHIKLFALESIKQLMDLWLHIDGKILSIK